MRKLVILSVTALLMGGLLGPSLLYADDLAGTAVKQDSSTIDPSIKPPQAEEALHSCTSEQVELFSCPLKSSTTLALCLDKNKLTTELVRIDPQGFRTASLMSDLKQVVHTPNNHGYQTDLRGYTSDGIITLFLDTNFYDMTKPALSTTKGEHTNIEFCADLKFNIPESRVTVNNKSILINIRNLLGFGLAKPLTEEPDWPNEDGSFTSMGKYYSDIRKNTPVSNEKSPH